ncbi:MAG: hypothetical protein IPI41_03060 [Flavobacteriales bacterium]|nr:hypothetical protein [Flavobacteriales bacterium]
MKHGPSYLQGHRWLDITRDERFFCAELYQALKEPQNLKALIQRINSAMHSNPRAIQLDEHGPWEVGFEVAFYRDMVNALGYEGTHAIGSTQFSRKRTFDLCLYGRIGGQVQFPIAEAWVGDR